MSGPFVEEPLELSAEMEQYYREMLQAHRVQTGTKVCVVCGIKHCNDYVYAFTQLTAAGVRV